MDKMTVNTKINKNQKRKKNKKCLVEVIVNKKEIKKNGQKSKKNIKSKNPELEAPVLTTSENGTNSNKNTSEMSSKKRKLMQAVAAEERLKKKQKPSEDKHIDDMLSDNLNFVPQSGDGDSKDINRISSKSKKIQKKTKPSERTQESTNERKLEAKKRKSNTSEVTKDSAKVPKLQTESEPGKSEEKPESPDTSPEKEVSPVSKEERTAFVGNLPIDTDRKKLKTLFQLCGSIESTRLRGAIGKKGDAALSKRIAVITKTYSENAKSVYAYVVFKNKSGLKNACKLNGADFEGCKIRVDTCSKEKEYDTKFTVFLGNLPYDVTDNALLVHFAECEPIDYVRIIRDKETGKGKGFGYIKFTNSSSFCLALKMNESRFEGRSIRVRAATTSHPANNTAETTASTQKSTKVSRKPKHMARKLAQQLQRKQEQTKNGEVNVKPDKSAGKLDKSASKLDKSAGKLDKSAGKLDKSAGKLDKSAGKHGKSKANNDVKKTGITKASNRVKSSFPIKQPKKFKKRNFDKTRIDEIKKVKKVKKATTPKAKRKIKRFNQYAKHAISG